MVKLIGQRRTTAPTAERRWMVMRMAKICGIVFLIFGVLVAVGIAVSNTFLGAWDYLLDDDDDVYEDDDQWL